MTVPGDPDTTSPGGRPLELLPGKEADVGGITVRRLLPRATRRTVGAWCFVDHAGPIDASDASMQVGPHPHTGLHTVTWMLDGEVVHRDSLGSEQVLRPGQVNLMTAPSERFPRSAGLGRERRRVAPSLTATRRLPAGRRGRHRPPGGSPGPGSQPCSGVVPSSRIMGRCT